MTKDDAHSNRQWHPAFFKAIELELFEYRDCLEFRYEYHLASGPLQIDLLIVKKTKDVAIDKNIARIFRSNNLLEYKSPGVSLSVKDFWQVCAYANLYAAITPGVDLSDLTLTFIENRHPDTLLGYLAKTRGYTVLETTPGIYAVTGDYLPIQIIESKKLSEDENFWLNSLRGGLKESSLDAIYREGKNRTRGINIDPYVDIVFRANKSRISEEEKMWQDTLIEIFEERGVVAKVEERLREQFQEQWKKQALEQGLEQGIEQGIEKGREKTARNMLRMGMPLEDIARASELPVEKIRALAAAS